MAATLKQRHKEESIKLRYGSLYTVIELLVGRGFIRAKETSREGRRPERTVYALTDAGREELLDWMRDLMRVPVQEYPQFVAGLCLMPVLPPAEAVALLRDRATQLAGRIAQLAALMADLAQHDMPPVDNDVLAPVFARQKKFPPLFTIEGEYRIAMLKAELGFVNDLVRRIDDEGWGPVELWRDVQAAAARQHEKSGEGTM
jgi:DNA-binding PadR family transcriptional regulator